MCKEIKETEDYILTIRVILTLNLYYLSFNLSCDKMPLLVKLEIEIFLMNILLYECLVKNISNGTDMNKISANMLLLPVYRYI